MKKRFLVILGVFLLVFVAVSLAISCTSDLSCKTKFNSTAYSCVNYTCQKTISSNTTSTTNTTNYYKYYCRNTTTCQTKFGPKYTCVGVQCKKTKILRNATNTTSTNTSYFNVVQQINSLQSELTALNKSLNTNTLNIQKINLNVQKLGSDLTSLKTGQQSIKNTVSQTSQTVNSVSTGLASLQKNVKSTDTKVSNITTKLSNVEKSRPLTKTVLFILITIFTAAGVLLFVLYKRAHTPDLPLDLMKYIHQSMNADKPYSVIRRELLQAGWTEEQADEAYKEVLSHRYEKHKKSKRKPSHLNMLMGRKKDHTKKTHQSKTTKTSSHVRDKESSVNKNKKKLLIFGGIGLIVFIIVFAVLMKTGALSGKAIQTQYAFEESKPFVCTPPHIETVGGCCLDKNKNNVCDDEEEYEKNKTKTITTTTTTCNDNNECSPGQFCINKKCGSLLKEYQTECPNTKKCQVHDIAILTSDGEIYNLHAKQGSYTAAGALAWTIKTIPSYCTGAPIKVPIEIEKTDLVDSKVKVVGKEVIILRVGQTSSPITHPNSGVNKLLSGFTLSLTDAQETCY